MNATSPYIDKVTAGRVQSRRCTKRNAPSRSRSWEQFMLLRVISPRLDAPGESEMNMIDTLRPTGRLSAVLLLIAGTDYPQAQAFASVNAARTLTWTLQQQSLDAIAAADPAAPGTFVAALYIPGGMLLVVSARHPSTEAVAHRIAMRQYREVYLDLQATPTVQDKFFVQDAGADGILSALPGSGDVDVVYEDGVRRTLFNGDSRAQRLTPSEYDAKLAAADVHYSRLLTLLTAAARQNR